MDGRVSVTEGFSSPARSDGNHQGISRVADKEDQEVVRMGLFMATLRLRPSLGSFQKPPGNKPQGIVAAAVAITN